MQSLVKQRPSGTLRRIRCSRISLYLAQQDDSRRNIPRPVCRTAWRRGSTATRVRARNSQNRRDGTGNSAGGAGYWRGDHGRRGGPLAIAGGAPARPCSGAFSALASSPLSSGSRALVALAVASLVALGACDMVSVIVRHTLVQTRHSRRDARPCQRGQHGLHRRLQRGGAVRVADSPRSGSARFRPWSGVESEPSSSWPCGLGGSAAAQGRFAHRATEVGPDRTRDHRRSELKP